MYVDGKVGDVGVDYHFNPLKPVNDSVAQFWRRGYYAAVSCKEACVCVAVSVCVCICADVPMCVCVCVVLLRMLLCVVVYIW